MTFLSGEMVAYTISLITFIIIARTVKSEGYGYLALAASGTIWLELMVGFGINIIGAKWVANRPSHALYILKRVLSFRLTIAFTLMAGLALFILIAIEDRSFQAILWARSLILLAVAFNVGYLFVGLSRPFPFVLGQTLWPSLYLISIFLFLREDTPLAFIPLANGLMMLTVYVALVYWAMKHVQRSVAQSDFVLETRMVLRESTPIMLSNLVTRGYYNLGIILLGIWGTIATVGAYAAATRILQAALFVLVALLRTFGPRLAAISSTGDKDRFDRAFAMYRFLCLGVGFVGMIGIFGLARPATHLLLGGDFEESGVALQVLSLSFLAIALHTPYSSALPFVSAERSFLLANLIGFLVNCLSCLLFIPIYGYLGACIASILGGVAILVSARWSFRRWYSRFTWTTSLEASING